MELQQAAQNARNRGALWRLAKDGRHAYLYSTVHVGKLEWAAPGPTIRRSLREAETIAIETDVTNPAFSASMTAPQKPGEGPTLSPSLMNRLRAQAAKVCAPWEHLAAMPPMMIVSTLAVLGARWEGLHFEYGTEFVLLGFAHAAGKSIVELEDAATQRGALMGGSPAAQLAVIEASIDSLEDGTARKDIVTTASAWATGDLDALAGSLGALKTAERAAIDRLVFARNPALAARIDELHRSGGRLFAAVGILHMIGDTGLPTLLAARGFKVERLPFDDR